MLPETRAMFVNIFNDATRDMTAEEILMFLRERTLAVERERDRNDPEVRQFDVLLDLMEGDGEPEVVAAYNPANRCWEMGTR